MTQEVSWSAANVRRLQRHALLPPAPAGIDPSEVAAVICGAHSQLLSAAELSIALRIQGATRDTVRRALWDDHTLIKTYGPRGTVHLLAVEELPIWTAALSAIPARSPFPDEVRLTPQQAEEVVDTIGHALEDAELTIDELDRDQFMLAASPQMLRARRDAALIAKADIPVLLLGESGTGKEIMARYIHSMSPRAKRSFMKVNCAALPADLLESELFGYEAGAFTGATKAKPGKFELCDQGTILLDEIGEIPPVLQAKLLHVLQDQQFSRLGGRSMIKVNVRILAANEVMAVGIEG